MAYIELEKVSRRFGQEEVLKELTWSLEAGQVYGIVGNNGSGKTVLMKCICGFLPVTSGVIKVGGRPVSYTHLDVYKRQLRDRSEWNGNFS